MAMKTNDNLQADLSHSHRFKPFRSAEKVVKATRTLLIVGDDPALRQLEVEILCQTDYEVLQAHRAQEALRLARQVDVIHLLITDFSVLRVDSLELSHRFRSIHPQTPVLMISGSLPRLGDGTRDLEHVVLLAKPFTMNELLDKVRTLLDAAFVVPVRKQWSHD